MSEQQDKKSYDSSSIKILRGLDAVRKRPGMYIGDPNDGTGLHHMVFEVLDNSIDEALAGYCSNIKVTLHEDGSVSVADDGRGIPTEIHPEEGISGAEVIMTILHAGGKFDDNSYKVSGGLHGVGVSVVNALSSKLVLTIHRNGAIHTQTYHDGTPQAPLEVIGTTSKTGTTVRFWPSAETFATTEFDYDILAYRIRELSFLNSGVNITLIDERDGRKDNFHYEGGVVAFVNYLNQNQTCIIPEPLFFAGTDEKLGISVEIAMQWNDTDKEVVNCYCNNIPQKDGGTHLAGFKAALTRTVNSYIEKEIIEKAKSKAVRELKIDGDDSREGLVAIVSVKVPDAKYSSQTKEKLVSSEVRPVVDSTVSEQLDTYLQENPKIAQVICDKILEAARTREAMRRARELAKSSKKNTFTTNKLVHCNSKVPEECEIYLVEGDSAGGSAVKARDVQTQAILPLRGKILNVEKARFDKVIESQEITNIIATLKCGIGKDDFNLANLRYHKIVIMTDADVDGSHIRTLLLTFFYRQMPQLIEAGKLFIAQPPLYKLTVDRKPVYLKNDDEYEKFLIDYSLDGSILEVEDRQYPCVDLREVCDFYKQVESQLKRHTKKHSQEFMKSLIGYTALTVADLKDQEAMKLWIKNLLERLEFQHQKSIRFAAVEMFDEESGCYNYQIEEVKHGISSFIDINETFINSRDYKDVVKLTASIDEIFPEQATAAIIRGETRKPVTSFINFIEQLQSQAIGKLKPSRYKGLGEMNWEELEETTMRVDKRTLLKVEVKDAIAASQLFATLMGDDVTPRREFIEENAIYANVDL